MQKLKGSKENRNKGTSFFKNKSGITLIALVITITILLVLAGISIAALTGENGLINKAASARENTEIAQETEILQQAAVVAMGKSKTGDVDETYLRRELERSNIEVKTTGNGFKATFPNGRVYTITKDGDVKNYKKVNPTDVYAAVCANGVLVFSNNTEDIEQYLSANSTSIADGYEIENITDKEFDGSYYYDEELDKSIYSPSWYGDYSIQYAEFLNEVAPKSTAYWFYHLTGLESIQDISKLNTCNVTNMSYMFYSCTNLKNLDLSNFNTSSVTNMNSMFSSSDDYIVHLTNVDFSGFDTSNVTDMSYMFSQVIVDSEVLDLRSFNTKKVTNMSHMFEGCYGLTNLDLSNFNTSNVTNMSSMFYNCRNIVNINLTSFDTSKVTNMGWMFGNCQKLTTIYVGEKWSTNSVTTGHGMFYNCRSLVGGMGTKCAEYGSEDDTYAHIDGGTSNPGYFTAK